MVVKITYFVHGTTTDNEDSIATGDYRGLETHKIVAAWVGIHPRRLIID